jgi:hypothetical protein
MLPLLENYSYEFAFTSLRSGYGCLRIVLRLSQRAG